MALKIIRSLCFTIFPCGIAGLIISSIAGNNEGWVLTIGMITAAAAIILMVTSAITTSQRVDVFNEAVAERVEQRIRTLVAAGADETEVRSLVRDTIDLYRGQQ